jgi:hypothetical protein
MTPLAELRERIRQTAPSVGRLPYSHNIIRLTLVEIDRNYGREEANKAVLDFHLERKGFNTVDD